MRKPPYVSHYLVLSDLIEGIEPRQFSDEITYFTSRIENIKLDLVGAGLLFDDDAVQKTKYSYYKPYVLIDSPENVKKAKELLECYCTPQVKAFLGIE